MQVNNGTNAFSQVIKLIFNELNQIYYSRIPAQRDGS